MTKAIRDLPEFLFAKDVATDLGVCRTTALTWLKRIPGAEMLYRYEGRNGERWRVSRAAYDAWRARYVSAVFTTQTKQTG